ncbi:MAG TPA: hypothetical protein ACFYED_00090 [Candidatus Tripitaka californicus]|uniref:hypothetical protein n=1 Tax=Candidatus Tripitaka californicus TaxID=3367616 RepID=UPI00402582B4
MAGRYPEPIMQMIWAQFCPTVPGIGKDATPIPDPDVLYVGPLIDGIALYMPQITFGIPNESDRPASDKRRLIKSILLDLQGGDRARMFDIRDVLFIMLRAGWPKTRNGEPQQLRLSDRVVENEPGELTNSYEQTSDPETMETKWMERQGPKDAQGRKSLIPFAPKIRIDKRWGLHYLRRDDRFTFSFTDRRGFKQTMDFSLRPLSEGSSLVTPEIRTQQATW